MKSNEIDPVHYERSYFVEPEPAGLKPYALLMRALDEKDVVAVAKIALRQRESLCVIRPLDGALMLDKLYYPDEVRTKDKPTSGRASIWRTSSLAPASSSRPTLWRPVQTLDRFACSGAGPLAGFPRTAR